MYCSIRSLLLHPSSTGLPHIEATSGIPAIQRHTEPSKRLPPAEHSRKKESVIPDLIVNLLFNTTFSLLPRLVHGICLLTPVILEETDFFLGIEATPALTLIPNEYNFCYPFPSSRPGSEKQHIRSAGV